MKVILISEALPEPYELDSETFKGPYGSGDDTAYWFAQEVAKQVSAVLETEKMRSAASQHKHGLFR